MNLRDLRYQADENFDPEVVADPRSSGWDVATAAESGLLVKADVEVLRHSFARGRAILTHDRDFGGVIVVGKEPVVGVVFLRPGHILPEFTIGTIQAVEAAMLDLQPPFILVAHRRAGRVSIRLRRVE